MSRRVSLGTVVAVAAFGCGSAFSAQDGTKDADTAAEASGGVAGSDTVAAASDGGSEGAAPEGAAPCAGTGGPAGVRVGAYCIDATEVTNRQYAAFLANQTASTDNQPPVCAWNTSYVPAQDWPVAAGRDNGPVTYVDWCDAFAFCRWTGKRMCGKIGGGANNFSDFANASRSQWYQACSKAGVLRYPYGRNLDSKACNVIGAGIDHAVNVQELPGCQGGYDGIYDMVGNVEEWEDACDSTLGAADNCRSRGLSYRFGDTSEGCALDDFDTRNATYPDLGIRCCTD